MEAEPTEISSATGSRGTVRISRLLFVVVVLSSAFVGAILGVLGLSVLDNDGYYNMYPRHLRLRRRLHVGRKACSSSSSSSPNSSSGSSSSSSGSSGSSSPNSRECSDTTGDIVDVLGSDQLESETKVVSTKRIVGPKATGETCHIVIDHKGDFPYWEGQSWGVIPPGVREKDGKPHAVRLYSLASSRYADDMGGKTGSLCVPRAAYMYRCPELKAEDDAAVMLMPEEDPSTDYIMVATRTIDKCQSFDKTKTKANDAKTKTKTEADITLTQKNQKKPKGETKTKDLDEVLVQTETHTNRKRKHKTGVNPAGRKLFESPAKGILKPSQRNEQEEFEEIIHAPSLTR